MAFSKGDIKILNDLFDERFAKQDKRIDKKFAEQEMKNEERHVRAQIRIDKRFESMEKVFDKKLDDRLKESESRTQKAIGQEVEIALENYGVVKNEDIKHLPTKEDYYSREAKPAKELKDLREEHDTQGEQVHRNSDRLDKIEKHLNFA